MTVPRDRPRDDFAVFNPRLSARRWLDVAFPVTDLFSDNGINLTSFYVD
jgi:hypothetical protein